MSTSLFVLIPTHGRAPLLERTLASLAQCELPEGYVETVVVENGSKEGAEAICQQADPRLKVRYLHVEKANKSHALNEALRTLPQEALVVFFDDDVRFAPDVLAAYSEAAGAYGQGHFFGGPVGVDYEAQPPENIRPFLPASARGWSVTEGGQMMFLGANWASFQCEILALRGFDVNRGPGTNSVGQETDMQKRMKFKGARPVYLPNAMIWHYVSEDSFELGYVSRRQYRHGYSKGLDAAEEHGLNMSFLWSLVRYVLRFWSYGVIYAKADLNTRSAWAMQVSAGKGRIAGYVRGLIGGSK